MWNCRPNAIPFWNKLPGSETFTPGNLAQRHRKLSKPSCHCARPDSMGHGPTWTLTIKTRIQKSVYHAVPEEALFAQHLINFGDVSDQIHKAPVLVQLTARVIQRKFRNTPTSCLALDFACQLPSMAQSAAWGGALSFWIATFSDVWRQVAGGNSPTEAICLTSSLRCDSICSMVVSIDFVNGSNAVIGIREIGDNRLTSV